MRNVRIFICILALILLPSCAYPPIKAEDGIRAFLQAETGVPSGRVYALQQEDSADSSELVALLYGNGTYPPVFEKIEDGAVYLAYSHPYEIAVFRCKTRAATEELTKLCLDRLACLCAFWKNGEQRETTARGTVKVSGRYVFLIVGDEPEHIFSSLKSLL